MTNDFKDMTQILAGLAVTDVDVSVGWMRKVIGQTESERPMDGLASWYLGDAGVLQLILDPQRAGGSTVSFSVTDLAVTHARLHDAGIVFEMDDSTSQKFKLGVLEDPDGNSVTLVEAKSETDA